MDMDDMGHWMIKQHVSMDFFVPTEVANHQWRESSNNESKSNIPSGYLTQPWKMAHLQTVYLLQMVIFHGYVTNNQMVNVHKLAVDAVVPTATKRFGVLHQQTNPHIIPRRIFQ